VGQKDELRVGFARVHRRAGEIRAIYLAVSADENGEETILTYTGPLGELIPLVAKDENSLELLRRHSKDAAQQGQTVRIISFTSRKVRDTFPGIATGD
jgi:hypothetical protein